MSTPPQYLTPEYLAHLAKVRDMVPTSRNLCGFTGDCESEVMLAQTLRSSKVNLDERGAPFSVRSQNALVSAPAQCVDNARGYRKLLSFGYIEEVLNGPEVLLFLTPKALDAMEGHVANGHMRKRGRCPEC